MVPVLVLTHGNLADELLTAARKIDPHLAEGSSAMSLPWDVDYDQATRQLKHELKSADQGAGVLILTDMFGGTAANLALPFLEPDRVEVVTGVNLPMLVKLASLRGQELSLHDLAMRLTEAGQKSIRVASEYLRQRSSH
jgi:PTS system mannose-specific IIA component